MVVCALNLRALAAAALVGVLSKAVMELVGHFLLRTGRWDAADSERQREAVSMDWLLFFHGMNMLLVAKAATSNPRVSSLHNITSL